MGAISCDYPFGLMFNDPLICLMDLVEISFYDAICLLAGRDRTAVVHSGRVGESPMMMSP